MEASSSTRYDVCMWIVAVGARAVLVLGAVAAGAVVALGTLAGL